jgi:hypothetical protein
MWLRNKRKLSAMERVWLLLRERAKERAAAR